MATLQIEFNCLCLFVRDPHNRVVHVLMPTTHNHHHGGDHAGVSPTGEASPTRHTGGPASGGGNGSGEPAPGVHHTNSSNGEEKSDGSNQHTEHGLPPHVVRLLRFDAPAHDKGRSLEGWTLELGPEHGEAVTDLTLNDANAEIVDIGELTEATTGGGGRKVKKELIDVPNSAIATRITLRAGRLISLEAEAEWMFGGEAVHMAHRGVWEIDGVPDQLPWKSSTAGAIPPLVALSALGGEVDLPGHGPGNEKKGYRIRIFHVTEDGLPPADVDGALDPAAVKHHFRVFYDVVEHAEPTPDQLPEPGPLEGKTVNCGMAQAEVA